VKIRHFRWWIAALLAAATAVNYLDRQNFPIAVGAIKSDILLSIDQYAWLQSLFLAGYGIMYAGGGRIMDWLGTRVGYTVVIVWWSLANLMHGLVSGIFGLGLARVLLGLGEGGGFPGSAKAVSEWFPPKERSFAFGIFNTGSAAGMVVAVPLVTAIMLALGWRWVFIITGLAGIAWAAVWLWMYALPGQHPLVTEEESRYVREGLLQAGGLHHDPQAGSTHDNGKPGSLHHKIRWIDLLAYRQVWGLLLAKFFSDAVWWFLIFWLPKYLNAPPHNLDLKDVGAYGWIPYVGAGVGSFCGGYLSSLLMQKGLSLNHARKIALVISAGLMPLTIFVDWAPLWGAIALYTVGLLGHQFWSTIIQTLAADLFPSSIVGSFAGLLGAVGCLAGVLYQPLVGRLITATGSYSSVFLISGLLHPLSCLLILLLVGEIRMLPPHAVRLACKETNG
jgi:MFS transporter, ACS family, hexuronate transporter